MNPNAAIANQSGTLTSSDSGAIESCLHCGRPAVYRTSVDREIVAFCCVGCEGVYQFLRSHRLGTYYDILSRVDARAPTQCVTEDGADPGDGPSAVFDPERYRSHKDRNEYVIFFPGFTCAACLWLVDKVMYDIGGVLAHRIHLEKKLLILKIDRDDVSQILRQVLDKMASVGYHGFSPSHDEYGEYSRQKSKSALIQLGVAGAVFANVMLFSSSVYFIDLFGEASAFEKYFNRLSLVLTTLSLAVAGRSFFQNVYRSVMTKVLHIDVPIVLAVAVAWCFSVYHMAQGLTGVYFDSISGLVFFLLLGRYLNDMLVARAKSVLGIAEKQLAKPSTEIDLGARITVDHGMIVPADGVVISGIAEIRESFLTGESSLEKKRTGDPVYGGTFNFGSPFEMEVTATGTETWMSRVTSLANALSEKPSRMEQVTGAIARGFVWVTLGLAVIAGVVWSSSGFSVALEVVCSVLIVSCPCALAMGIPLANGLAAQRLWRRGIVLRKTDALDRAATIDTVVFDKTGTLTIGNLDVIDVTTADSGVTELLGCLHSLTRGGMHPVARAVHKWSEIFPQLHLSNVAATTHPGQGMEFMGCRMVNGTERVVQIRLGALSWVRASARTQSSERFFDAIHVDLREQMQCGILVHDSGDHEYALSLTLKDQERAEAKDVVATARRQGFKVRLLSGDRSGPAVQLGLSLGFKPQEIFAEKLPQEKLTLIEAWSVNGERILMVGDGINDASALKRAALGVAVSGGAHITKQVADVFLANRDLAGVVQIVNYGKYHTRTVQVILAISLAYNIIAIGLALSNHIHPLTAALIMPLSSLTVVIGIWIRKGDAIWKSSTSLCRLPSRLPA